MGSPFNEALIHVFKHSGNDVYGLLVANNSDLTTVSGCLPLFHSRFVSAPLLRIAMSMIDELPDIQIVALYYASETCTDKVPPVAKWIINELQDKLKRTDILLLEYSEELASQIDQVHWPFQSVILNSEKGSMRKSDISNLKVTFSHTSFSEILKNHDYATMLTDFEDHINNPTNDWLRIAS